MVTHTQMNKMYIGARVMFVGDDINLTPNINTTLGTVHEIAKDYVYVAWDDNTEQEEDPNDLIIINIVYEC